MSQEQTPEDSTVGDTGDSTVFGGFADVAEETPEESVHHEQDAVDHLEELAPVPDEDGVVLPDDGLPDQIAADAAHEDPDPLAGATAAMPID